MFFLKAILMGRVTYSKADGFIFWGKPGHGRFWVR